MNWQMIKQSTRLIIVVLLSCIGLTLLSAVLMYFFPGNELKTISTEYRSLLLLWRIGLYAVIFYILYKIGQKNAHWAVESKRLAKKMGIFVAFAELINVMNILEATNA
ncbi:hypothetical protein QV08_00050 [Gallibacterium salpingitidis]|uniref:hypothetical protein n=1 Tax=Gallibacterium salpingitidis TaxID=505341 RepID=UPI000804FC06|nr:hypothetical protein [Gallibacterium salpingitidis]OBX10082.1 hypothetical protein QV08_00050 [Gallibacterium salpingitidis]